MNKKIKIAIVDSGVNLQQAKYNNHDIQFTSYGVDNSDTINHGTEILNIICESQNGFIIYPFKAFSDLMVVNLDIVIDILCFIDENLDVDIINMSFGVPCCDRLQEFQNICEKLHRKGIILVSSFDNEGRMTYPAAFKSVIGVDSSDNCKKVGDFEFIDGSEINIRGFSGKRRVKWNNPSFVFVQGNSFLSADITRIIADELVLDEKQNFIQSLKLKSKKIIKRENPYTDSVQSLPIIKNVILFPLNKEIQNLVRFENMLTFRIKDIYDTKYSGLIGLNVNSVIKNVYSEGNIIRNVQDIDWKGDFDTVIIGHVKERSVLEGIDYLTIILDQCLKQEKNVIILDHFSKYDQYSILFTSKKLFLIGPEKYKSRVPVLRFGKLWDIKTPVIGIFGTSSQQGKFTLQLELRKKLINRGYTVGQLGSEPTSILYGFDECFHFGYDHNIDLDNSEVILLLNQMMKNIDNKKYDIILTGSQSGTVPFDFGNLLYYTLQQNVFLNGTLPDLVVICVNPYDNIDYIKRTIRFIESSVDTYVIGMVLFPFTVKIGSDGVTTKRVPLSEDICMNLIEQYKTAFDIDVYLLKNDSHIDLLCDKIIYKLSSGEDEE